MEEELNYLSEKIETVESKITKLKYKLTRLYAASSKSRHEGWILAAQKEKQILENILSALTISELNKNK